MNFDNFKLPDKSIRVKDGSELREALKTVEGGTRIECEPGVYTGGFMLPKKSTPGPVYIMASNLAALGKPGQRIDTSKADALPKFFAPKATIPVTAEPGAEDYRLVGLEIAPLEDPSLGVPVYNLVQFGYGRDAKQVTKVEDLPDKIVFDRCWVHGWPTHNLQRGIAFNVRSGAVLDSVIDEIHWVGVETQAIAAWNAQGPIQISGNRLESGGMGLMLGGATSGVQGLVCTGVDFSHNYVAKPVRWFPLHSQHDGSKWTVKCGIEFKSAIDVDIFGNVIEHAWVGSQHGFLILITPRGQRGSAPWQGTQNFRIVNNLLRNAAAGIHIVSGDDTGESLITEKIHIENNLLYGIDRVAWNGYGRILLTGKPTRHPPTKDITFRRNTAIMADHNNSAFQLEASPGVEQFDCQGNIFSSGVYCVHSSGGPVGMGALTKGCATFSWKDNGIIDSPRKIGERFKENNRYVLGVDQAGFWDHENHDYRLKPDSPFAGLGADIDVIEREVFKAIRGDRKLAEPPPPPKKTYDVILAGVATDEKGQEQAVKITGKMQVDAEL